MTIGGLQGAGRYPSPTMNLFMERRRIGGELLLPAGTVDRSASGWCERPAMAWRALAFPSTWR